MSKATPTPKNKAEDEAAFDDWLAAADTTMLQRAKDAIDLDEGCAAIFAKVVEPEACTEDGGAQWEHLESVLREAADSIAPWLALRGLYALPHQLDKAITTTRTMTVVGRALLPDDMRIPWGLASDFLIDSNGDLTRLKHGLVQRSLSREEALALHNRVVTGITNFRAAFQQSLGRTTIRKAHQVGERLIATAEMLILLMRWTRDSIDHIFDDSDCPTSVPVS